MQPVRILICLFIFFSMIHASHAQVVVARNDRFAQTVVSGITNEILVAVTGKKQMHLSVSVSDGSISKISGGKYYWKLCDSTSGTVYLNVLYKGKLLETISFTVIRMPDQRISIGGAFTYNKNDTIILTRLRAQQGISACFDDFAGPDEFCSIVTGFIVKVFHSDSLTGTYPHTGNKFSPEFRQVLDQLASGDKLIFSNIEVRNGCETIPRKYKGEYSLYIE